eukprot:scaffold26383_cov99-Isochrysis_galbana.AAC.2
MEGESVGAHSRAIAQQEPHLQLVGILEAGTAGRGHRPTQRLAEKAFRLCRKVRQRVREDVRAERCVKLPEVAGSAQHRWELLGVGRSGTDDHYERRVVSRLDAHVPATSLG